MGNEGINIISRQNGKRLSSTKWRLYMLTLVTVKAINPDIANATELAVFIILIPEADFAASLLNCLKLPQFPFNPC